MGAALKKFWNRIIEFTNPSVDLGQPKYPSAEVAVSSLEERYRNILAQLNKSEDEMIAYIESRSVFNRPLEEAYKLYKMSLAARSIRQNN